MEEIEPPHRDSKAVSRSRDVYRALVAHPTEAILGVDSKGTIVFWNRGAEQLFGYSSSEILGQPLTRLIAEKHKEGYAQTLARLLTGNAGRTALIEGEASKKDGSTFLLELSFCFEGQDGEFLGLAIGRNITQPKSIEQALRESAERYCDLFATCLEAVFSGDISGRGVLDEKALGQLCSYCLRELTRMKPAKTLSSEGAECLASRIDQILNTGEPVSSILHRVLEKDGKRILVERYLNLITTRNEGTGFSGFGSGPTHRNKTQEQLKPFVVNLAKIVCRIIEFGDPYTAWHQQGVAELACVVGESMGLAPEAIERLYLDGLLHDIGKLSIPRTILTKPGELTQEEWALIRAHTRQGYSILQDIDFPWPIAEVALQHHERLDGSGYPDGITEENLSLEVSILAVCDVVEAMGSHRPYRPARTAVDIVRELAEGRGTKYNASVVDVVLPKIGSGEFRSVWNHGKIENTDSPDPAP